LKINLKGAAALAALGLVYAAGAQTNETPKRRLTLREAIDLAVQRQPDLASARAQAAAADQQHRQAKAAYYPSITLGFTTNDSYTNRSGVSSSAGSNLGSGASSVSSTRQADLVLSYNLLDNGQRVANEQSARAGSKAATYSALDQRQATIANAATYYYELLRRTALVKVQEANIQRAQSTLDLTKAQVGEGTQAKKDVYQVQADLETAKVDLLTAQNNLSISQAQLRQVLGLTDEQDIDPADDPAGVAVSTFAEQSLSSLLEQAYATRPDLLQAQQNVEREKANVRLSRATNGLTVALDTNLSAVFLQSQSNTRAIGLTASLPIFNGGANRAAVKQAEQTQKAAEAQLASARLVAKVDVETAYRTLQTARAAVPAALAAQQAAQINYEAASESRKEGIGTVVDVITAQSQLVEAQTNYVQALYSLYNADVALQRAVGHAEAIAGGVK